MYNQCNILTINLTVIYYKISKNYNDYVSVNFINIENII